MTSRHGLANVGNTCYLNSAIQALARSSFFRSYFDGTKAMGPEEGKGFALASTTAALVRDLYKSGDTMINPAAFVRAFIEFAHTFNEDIRFGAQADAAEAVQILMDGLHMQVAREVIMKINHVDTDMTDEKRELASSLESWKQFFNKEYSPFIGAFYGQTQTKVICTGCGASSTRYEPWAVLKVPIPGADKEGADAPNLQACVAGAFASETLDDYDCTVCKTKGPAAMKHAISRYPVHMILSLKRFTNQGLKVRARIAYDDNRIDLGEWCAWPSLQGQGQGQRRSRRQATRQGSQCYRVISTVEHLGGSRGGHYVMRNRDPTDGQWYLYDDGSVRVSPIGGSAGHDTYMLFLEQISG